VSAVARAIGADRSTVRYWRDHPIDPSRIVCPICDPASDGLHPDRHLAYAYLLGAYLGDGYLAAHARSVYKLSVFCTTDYPMIFMAIAATMRVVMPRNKVMLALKDQGGCVVVYAYSKHWPCLFPQHGAGLKHQRDIRLEPWQRAIVEAHPRALLRGLIHSDGSRFINRVRVAGKAYEYPRYNFSNESRQIRTIFCDACDALGIEWAYMNASNISVARRASVAELDEFIGPKA
jgi:hypothetical protein